MTPKQILAAAASAALVTGAALLAAFWPGDKLCRVCTVIVAVEDKGVTTKSQADWEICGAEPKDPPDYPGLVRVVQCGEAYADDKPPAVTVAPVATAAPAKDTDPAATIGKTPVIAGTSALSLGATGAACADQRRDALLCERRIHAYPGSPERWERAPAATILEAGDWRGKGCIASLPFETELREESGGPGSQIRPECRKP
jgi:hypothetical protein